MSVALLYIVNLRGVALCAEFAHVIPLCLSVRFLSSSCVSMIEPVSVVPLRAIET